MKHEPPTVTTPPPPASLWHKVTVIVGGLFLLGLVLSAWLPPSCPLLRDTIIGCSQPTVQKELTAYEKSLNSIGHQDITSSPTIITAKAQNYRLETSIRFQFWDEGNSRLAYLQVKKNTVYQPLVLIQHPLLASIDWQSVGTSDFRLYQRQETYHTVNELRDRSKLPPHLAADQVTAKEYNLPSSAYVLLDNLTSLDGIDYILTSYSPSYKNGDWRQFDRTFDLTDADVDSQNNLNFAFVLPTFSTTSSTPFHLGTVHIDYGMIAP